MASRVGVINRALLKLGVPTIADPNEESEQARVAALLFDDTVRAELRDNPWSFAMTRVQLAALTQAPAFGFARRFQLPSDFVRLVQAGEYYEFSGIRNAPLDTRIVPYRIEGQAILTDWPAPLQLRYIRDVSAETGIWDALFIDAFACRLAREMSQTLTKNTSLLSVMDKLRAEALRNAKRLNAIELPPEPLPDNSWTYTRYP